MADKRSTVKWTTAKIGSFQVRVKVTTIYNIEPTHYVVETPCPLCSKTAIREHRLEKRAINRSVDNMKIHYEAIHIRGSHNPTKKKT
jgi:hypothetical protein